MSFILLVEDEPDSARTYRDLLESEGYEVRVAETGERALEMIRDEHPSLVLLDLLLPDMHGLEVARALATRNGDGTIPIVVVTCLNQYAEDDPEILRLPAIKRFLYKPCRPKTLLAGIRDVLGSHAS